MLEVDCGQSMPGRQRDDQIMMNERRPARLCFKGRSQVRQEISIPADRCRHGQCPLIVWTHKVAAVETDLDPRRIIIEIFMSI
jgi:hypothetical protein